MTHKQKIQYMKIAGNLCQLHFKDEHLDLLVCLYDLVLEKEGNADLMAISRIESEVEERHKVKPVVIPNNEYSQKGMDDKK